MRYWENSRNPLPDICLSDPSVQRGGCAGKLMDANDAIAKVGRKGEMMLQLLDCVHQSP